VIGPLRRTSHGRPGVILDRDGTIIVDHGYVGTIDRVDFIPGAAEAIAAFNRAGLPVAVTTNQSGVARGHYGIDDVEKLHEHMAGSLAERGARVDLYLFCPDHPDGTVEPYVRRSFDRKPSPGMALAAARSLGLDLASSWVVGDRPEDMAVAAAVGAFGVFLGPDHVEHDGTWSFPDLASAAPMIIRRATGSADGGPPGPSGTRAGRRKFPSVPVVGAGAYGEAYFVESHEAARSIDPASLHRAATVLADGYGRGAVVFACGNGGSASIANHLQCDHLKGVQADTPLQPRVVSLTSNVELITAIANDLCYPDVFSYQLQAQARPDDVLIAISSSGSSPNIVRSLEWANEHGLHTIAFTGFDGGRASSLADVSVHVDSKNYGVVEDTHQAVMHLLAQYIRQCFMSPDAVADRKF